jgi:hypothetical protein
MPHPYGNLPLPELAARLSVDLAYLRDLNPFYEDEALVVLAKPDDSLQAQLQREVLVHSSWPADTPQFRSMEMQRRVLCQLAKSQRGLSAVQVWEAILPSTGLDTADFLRQTPALMDLRQDFWEFWTSLMKKLKTVEPAEEPEPGPVDIPAPRSGLDAVFHMA